ncbi:OmpA family protein [Oceaniradius stylonematis]|uniref:OmpA family protein n=1 Tax=Oceaniradius stylonematis TaxID=2184161 RepID=A0A3A8ALH1_9HYPH|nr:OmpA family protein [Oceaniradius stylonematis]RKF06581.1 OmpA family protein [Oceaniradius stylonematis]
MTRILDRRAVLGILAGGAATFAAPPRALAQSTPTAAELLERLGADPSMVIAPDARVSVRELTRRRDLRRIAPSVDVQSINFAFGSARIPPREIWKIDEIASAMRQLLRRRGRELFLIEGHTDAVGSNEANLRLSRARARSVADELARSGIPNNAIETIGYGEEDLLVPTQRADWRNRRVTLRRVTDLVIGY